MDIDINPRDVQRVLTIARNVVMADPFWHIRVNTDWRCLALLRSALIEAWPEIDADELGAHMGVDDPGHYAINDPEQTTFWYSPATVARLADVLNEDRVPPKPKREVKPVPAELLSTPGLPMCGPKRERSVEVVRRTMPERAPRPVRVATPWDPPEARLPRPPKPQRVVPVSGEPPYHRSALYERRMAAGEVRA